ncbi:MAG: hypothetical protein IJI35_12200 [Kiritimatiellae bacterium]|nr:hypothetical protein [Kiritimatiellia bacterium]
MTYTYAYKTSDGVRHEGSMDASSREEVFTVLRARGIRPIKVVAADGSKANGEKEEVRRKKEEVWRGIRLVLLVLFVPLVLAVLVFSRKAPGTQANPPSTPRHQIYGDPATMEAFERGEFGDALPREGDRMLAVFAQPGRLMCRAGFDPQRLGPEDLGAFADYAKGALAPDADIPVAAADPREVRELRQIVNGMRQEMREYLANGNGTPRSYWRRLNERTLQEAQIYERTRRELEGEESSEAWESKNDALRRLGLRTIPTPKYAE